VHQAHNSIEEMYPLVYFSSLSGNTDKFVKRLGLSTLRIPLSPKEPMVYAKEPFILVTPTYSDNEGNGAVPKQVIKFLNDINNRNLMVGVIAGGNTNFGQFYGHAGTVISKKCNIPLLYKFELTGTEKDIENVQEGVARLWQQHSKQPQRA